MPSLPNFELTGVVDEEALDDELLLLLLDDEPDLDLSCPVLDELALLLLLLEDDLLEDEEGACCLLARCTSSFRSQ